MESLLNLGMSLPSPAGHSSQEMPPKHGQIRGYEGTGSGYSPAASAKITSWLLQVADLQHPLKGAQGGDQKQGTLCSGKNPEEPAFG